jgi:ABC-type sulfate transport system permease component
METSNRPYNKPWEKWQVLNQQFSINPGSPRRAGSWKSALVGSLTKHILHLICKLAYAWILVRDFPGQAMQ